MTVAVILVAGAFALPLAFNEQSRCEEGSMDKEH
jgi:hypothetical protein